MARRIKKANIKFVSLCPRGMNGLRTIYKAAPDDLGQGSAEFVAITKALPGFDERGELVACVWAPNRLDREGDWADETTVKEMAYSFMFNGAKIDLRHDEKQLAKEDVYVVESFMIQKGDERFAEMEDHTGSPVDVTGGWGMVLKVNSPALRKAYRNGEWCGVSMMGPAITENGVQPPVVKESEDDMKPEEVKELAKAAVAEIGPAIASSVVKELTSAGIITAKKTEESKPAAPALPSFTGDVNDPEAIEKHLEAVEAAKVDWGDPVAVKKHLDKIKAKKAAAEEAEEDDDDEDDAEPKGKKSVKKSANDEDADDADDDDDDAKSKTKVKKSKRELELEKELAKERAKTLKKSNRSAEGSGDVIKGDDATELKKGDDLAARWNKRYGAPAKTTK